MMLYLTGADTSLIKSPVAPQNDSAKSLGGYISSTPVPNSEINILFDLISSYTLETKKKETIALELINKLSQAVTNVTLRVVVKKDNLVTFKIAAVRLSDSKAMERISNRYAEPLDATFYNADFQRASVDIQITNPAGIGEEIALYPFNVSFEVTEAGIEGTWNAFESAFDNNSDYEIERVSEKVFRLCRRDETVLETPLTCSYITTAGFSAIFLGNLENEKVGEVTLIEDGDSLSSEDGIGLWIQRDLKSYKYSTNEQLVEDFKNKVEKQTIEIAEIVINYDLVPTS